MIYHSKLSYNRSLTDLFIYTFSLALITSHTESVGHAGIVHMYHLHSNDKLRYATLHILVCVCVCVCVCVRVCKLLHGQKGFA